MADNSIGNSEARMEYLQDEYVAKGHILGRFGFPNLPAMIQYSYPKYSHEPVKCVISVEAPYEQVEKRMIVDEYGRKTFGFRGETLHDNLPVWIPAITWVSGSSNENSCRLTGGIAEIFIEGGVKDAFSLIKESDLVCRLFIPETPLATITKLPKNATYPLQESETYPKSIERTGIKWDTGFGEAEIIRSHYYVKDEKGVIQKEIVWAKCAVEIVVDKNQVISIKDLLQKLSSQEAVFWLLSFLGEKSVIWYEAHIRFVSKLAGIRIRRNTHIHNVDSYSNQHPKKLLVSPESLKEGNFSNMVSTFFNLDESYRQVLIEIIQNLLQSHQGYLSNQLSAIYIAVEMIVHLLTKDEIEFILDEEDFKQLKHSLQKHIKKSLPLHLQKKENSSVRKQIYAKLSELNRYSFKRKLQHLMGKFHIKREVLFDGDNNISFEKYSTKHLIERRNNYIHQGIITDNEVISQDILRWRGFVTILLLKLLDYDVFALEIVYAKIQYDIEGYPYWMF